MTWQRFACILAPNLRAPLFVVGSPRSGTTFLGRCLGNLPELSYHNEPSATMRACPLIYTGTWGEARSQCFYRFAARWQMRLALDADLRFVDKSPRNALIIPFLCRAFPDAQFVHIIRDGRDVTTSLAEKPWLSTNLPGEAATTRRVNDPVLSHFWIEADRLDEFVATTMVHRGIWAWRRFTESAMDALSQLPKADRHELRYEDMARHPEAEADRLLNFLDIREPASRSTLHDALLGVKTSSIGRWKTTLADEQMRQIRDEAGCLLDRLGYMEDER